MKAKTFDLLIIFRLSKFPFEKHWICVFVTFRIKLMLISMNYYYFEMQETNYFVCIPIGYFYFTKTLCE